MSNKNEDLGIDPVMEFLEKAKEWIEKNKNNFLVVVVAMAVAAVGYSGFTYMKSQKLEVAREAFGSASSLIAASQPEKALIAFQEIIDEYSGTVFEGYSAFMKGNILLGLEKYDEAEEMFFIALNSSKGTFIKGEALEGIGNCREALGDVPGALEYYKKAIKDGSVPHRVAALNWKLALLEKKAGNNESAIKYCEEIVSDTTAQSLKGSAENLKAIIEAL